VTSYKPFFARNESNLIITGANGFVGTSIMDFLISLEETSLPKRVYLLGRSPRYKLEEKLRLINTQVEYFQRDLTNKWDFEIPNAVLINLAADGSQSSYSQEASDSYIQIGENLTEWLKENEVRKIFHASTGAVTHALKPLTLDKSEHETPLSQKKVFINSRKKVESMLLDSSHKFKGDLTIARLFSFIGPNILEKKQYAVSSFIDQAFINNEIIVNGNPDTIRSYLDHKDMVAAILRSLDIELKINVFSLGSRIKVSIAELAQFIALETNSLVKYQNSGLPGDSYAVEKTDTSDKLMVRETVTWKESIKECIYFLRR
jgi:dTDP-glucose 4,6-dehydratase